MNRKKREKSGQIPAEPPESTRKTRTDLAMEERELWQAEAGASVKIPGVISQSLARRGILTTLVRIVSEEGSRELHKPQGSYLTLELSELRQQQAQAFRRVTRTLAGELSALMRLKEDASVLVVGLGNEDVTPDALGPLVLRRLLVTRHLSKEARFPFPALRPVSALQPGVLGATGMESFEVVRAVVDRTAPDALIAVDALAARSIDRLCSTVQLTDTGIIPGSGVGNRRLALTQERLGLPVFAIGAPTVVDAGALLPDAPIKGADMIVTPRSIDAQLRQIAGVIATALNLSLHNQLTAEQIEQLVDNGR